LILPKLIFVKVFLNLLAHTSTLEFLATTRTSSTSIDLMAHTDKSQHVRNASPSATSNATLAQITGKIGGLAKKGSVEARGPISCL
jgi:hypothetical protein